MSERKMEAPSSPELKGLSILKSNNNNTTFYRNNNNNNNQNIDNDTNHNMIESLGSRMTTTEYHDILSPPDQQKPPQQLIGVDPLSYRHDSNMNRLLYIAKYEKFYPQNLACSQPFIDASQYSYNSNTNNNEVAIPLFSKSHQDDNNTTNNNNNKQQMIPNTLGALGGSHGIAIFRISKPHEPLMILSLYNNKTMYSNTNTTSSTTSTSPMKDNNRTALLGDNNSNNTTNNNTGITSMCFQPIQSSSSTSSTSSSSSSLYLASARGSGIFVWDVSGHSLSPLWGRLNIENHTSTSTPTSHNITSLTWKSSTQHSPWLVGTTSSSVCFWDLRTPSSNSTTTSSSSNNSTSSNNNIGSSFKPNIRFTIDHTQHHRSNSNNTTASHFVQIACSDQNHEFAILDSIGLVRIYDTRKTPSSSSNTGGTSSLQTFSAHHHIGIGLAYMPLVSSNNNTNSSNSNCWITWGFDSTPSITKSSSKRNSAIVKIWMNNGNGQNNNSNTASWNGIDDGSTTPIPNVSSFDDSISSPIPYKQRLNDTSSSSSYQLRGQCSSINLACARICPSSIIPNTFMTISLPIINDKVSQTDIISWNAELYKINSNNTNTATSDNDPPVFLEKIVSFNGRLEQQTEVHEEVIVDGTIINNKKESNMNHSYQNIRALLGHTKYTQLGSLCAAEVGISSYTSPIYQQSSSSKHTDDNDDANNDNDEETMQNNTSNAGLILCCLSENGYVTTYAVPEALPKKQTKKRDKIQSISIINEASIGTTTQRPTSTTTKLFPLTTTTEQNDGFVIITDPANAWSNTSNNNKSYDNIDRNNDIDNKTNDFDLSDNNISDIKRLTSLRGISSSDVTGTSSYGGTMQFDMDDLILPGAFQMNHPTATFNTNNNISGVVNNIDVGSTNGDGDNSNNVIVEDDIDEHDEIDIETKQYVKDAIALMDKIEIDRIPCPRLCGATFGSGVGRLAVFHNGDVGKMWQWWQKTDPSRLDNVPGMIGEPNMNETSKLNVKSVNEDIVVSKDSNSIVQNFPRTLKDLTDMISAAKVAQWGEHESDASSTGFQATTDNFFDDDSTSSNSGNDDQPLQEVATTSPMIGSGKNVSIDRQQSNSDFNSSVQTLVETNNILRQTKRNNTAGPTSDTLSAVVKVTNQYDRIALNNQNKKLAMQWKLGDIVLVDETRANESSKPTMLLDTSDKFRPITNQLVDKGIVGKFPFSTRNPALPRYQTLHQPFLSSLDNTRPERYNSDPSIRRLVNKVDDMNAQSLRSTAITKDSAIEVGAERGVHGGEYSISPNKQESLVFFRKLFSHKNAQFDKSNSAAFQSHLTPPDSPIRPRNHKTLQTKRTNVFEGNDEKTSNRIGVYALRNEEKENSSQHYNTSLGNKLKKICLHNAGVCYSLGEYEKQEVWEFVAQTIENQVEQSNSVQYDGWRGAIGGGALGTGVIDSFLQYYERLGDVQMLATLVCVLRTRRQNELEQDHEKYPRLPVASLLPPNQDERYDTYIRRYADLLYGWDMLILRAEFNKHLVRVNVVSDEHMGRYPRIDNVTAESVSFDEAKPASIAVVFRCLRCGGNTDFGTNVCRTCQDYAFRCSICDNSVRGLFAICYFCGHGGHMDHLKSWFASHKECPTGCGCQCAIIPFASNAIQRDYTLPTSDTTLSAFSFD